MVAYWLDQEVLVEADLAERMAAYGGDAAEDQFEAKWAQELIKRLLRNVSELFGFWRVAETREIPVDECVAYRKPLLLLDSVYGTVRILLKQSFGVDCISELLDELPNLIVSVFKLLVVIDLVSFYAFYKSFNLIEPLWRAEATVSDYLA